jgi:hypothetical protein
MHEEETEVNIKATSISAILMNENTVNPHGGKRFAIRRFVANKERRSEVGALEDRILPIDQVADQTVVWKVLEECGRVIARLVKDNTGFVCEMSLHPKREQWIDTREAWVVFHRDFASLKAMR